MLPKRDEDPYIGWRPPFPQPAFEPATTALVVVDMQVQDAAPGGRLFRALHESGFDTTAQEYEARLGRIVPNIASLERTFRSVGAEVIHLRIRALTRDGRDRGAEHRKLGHEVLPGSVDSGFLCEIGPTGDELVFDKTTGSPFTSTNIEYVLRNLGMRTLVVAGVVTTGCVLSTTIDAAERGFDVVVVEDACGALVTEMHWAAIRIMRDVFASVRSTQSVIASLGT